MYIIKKTYCALLLFFLSLFSLSAQEKNVRAYRISSGINIDGVLSEKEWENAEPAKNFTQRDPKEGAPESERTEIKILYDDEYIYFGCMMYDSEPGKITARLARRDNEVESDEISIRLDTYHDHLTCYEFSLLASGTMVDILQYNNGETEDYSWNAVWEAKTLITDKGWSAEIKIPIKELRFDNSVTDKIWGINFVRIISRKHEYSMWRFIPKNQSGIISNYGHLTGINSINSSTRLEVLPYVLNSFRRKPAEPYESYKSYDYNTGLDIKYGLSSNYTLDVTVNPDFGQVEADPEVLNLTTFETFYPEKRPFFIEGTQILKFSGFGGDDGLFYSRRIGKKPGEEITLNDFEQIKSFPENTTILAAAKVTGKNSSGFSFGALNAITKDEYAKTVNTINMQEREILVEPMANYSVIRFNQDFMKNSTIGGIVTSVVRKKNMPAYTAGVDWKIRTNDNLFMADGFLALSSTYEKTNKEKLTGGAGRLTLAKVGGDHWLYQISTDFTGKEYNINDVGFFRRPNDHGSQVEIIYKDEVVGSWYRYLYIGADYGIRDNFDKVNLYRNSTFEFETCFLNYWVFYGNVTYNFGLYDDRETRGNGLYRKPKSYNLSSTLNTNSTNDIVLQLTASYSKNDRSSDNYAITPKINLKPASNIEVLVGLGYQRYNNYESFVANTYGNGDYPAIHTIFANRNTNEYNLNVTGSFTFMRNLTLELYSQLFFARGHYKQFKELVNAETFVDYNYPDNQDFNRNTFRLNSVLRWEYLPGSTIYLVWSQFRGYFDKIYDSSIGDNIEDTFITRPDNAITLKISYWINI